MYWLLILLHSFQQANSVDVDMYDAKMIFLDSKSLRIRFRIWGDNIHLLTGQFAVHHKECPEPSYKCGSSWSYQPPLAPGTWITIQADLSPCTKPLVIEVRSHRKNGWYTSKKWDFTGRIYHHISHAHILPYSSSQTILFVLNQQLWQWLLQQQLQL